MDGWMDVVESISFVFDHLGNKSKASGTELLIWTELFLVITGETKLPKLCNHSFGDSRGRPHVLSNRGVGSIPTA